jgi:CubicO group peptidase (beta-lactamase class C family)
MRDQLEARLVELADKHRVVGASLAVGVADETRTAAAGVLNRRTAQPVTPESVFQIGSITKVWTATLAMQLVDDGRLDLDAPVVHYLPNFRVLDEATTTGITPRHLLSHTSGIGGDFFPDTGRGDDCLERYVEAMAGLGSAHPLGLTMSYCNAGFVLLGRLIEVLRGGTWDDIVKERLFEPLRLEAAGTLPEEALLWGAAAGHQDGAVVPQWGLPRCAGPSGAIHARAVDLVTFARVHMAGGTTDDGATVLASGSCATMREPQVGIPDSSDPGNRVGLGWMLMDWGRPAFGHDGATIGQRSYLVTVTGPEPVTVALLTNGGDDEALYRELFAELFAEHARTEMPAAPEPPATPLRADAAAIVGSYVRESMTYVVEERAGDVALIARPSGMLAASLGVAEIVRPLLPTGPDTFLTQIPGTSGWTPVVFSTIGGVRYLHLAGLATPRRGA